MPILVTGASGFLAGHIVKQLLDAGETVRTPPVCYLLPMGSVSGLSALTVIGSLRQRA
jgi:UDP-glucose 4-epimerase